MVSSSTAIRKRRHVSKEFLVDICVPKKGWKNNHAYVFDGCNNGITIVITYPFKPHWFCYSTYSIPHPPPGNYIFIHWYPLLALHTFCLCFHFVVLFYALLSMFWSPSVFLPFLFTFSISILFTFFHLFIFFPYFSPHVYRSFQYPVIALSALF